MKQIIISLMLLITIVRPAIAKEINILKEFKTIKRIQLEKPMELYAPILVNKQILTLDRKAHEIVLIDMTGKIVWKYNKKGKGPGEMSDTVSINYKNNILYVVDHLQGKVMLFDYDNRDKCFTYNDEFQFNEGRISEVMVSESGKLFFPVLFGDHRIIETDSAGAVLGRYVPVTKTNLREMSRDDAIKAIREEVSVLLGDDSHILRAGVMSMRLQFLHKIGSTFTEVKQTKCMMTKTQETYDAEHSKISEGRQQLKVTTRGITSSYFDGINYYIMVMPDTDAIESLIEVYSLRGEFLGFYRIENEKDIQVGGVRFSDNKTILYQQWVRNACKEFETDTTTVYIATLD